MPDTENNYSIVNVEDIVKPAADVAVKTLGILERAGFFFAPLKAKYEANAALITEISENKNLDPFQRSAVISNFSKIVKEYKNQTEIIDEAVKILKADAKYNPDDKEIDNDWIMLFMDKAGMISDKDMQLIWSKILASEIKQPKSISKQLLCILFQMSSGDADSFKKLLPLCVDIYERGEDNGDVAPIFFRTNDENIDERYRITYEDLTTLSSLGLIEYNSLGVIVKGEKGVEFRYGNEVIYEKTGEYEITFSNATFTKAGLELFRINDKEVVPELVDYLKQTIEDHDEE